MFNNACKLQGWRISSQVNIYWYNQVIINEFKRPIWQKE